ncbi:hypothetical protein [Sorangium sp. So ce1182]|uniref:hypothetical protein n=1 Tax=Sorangium sp. So ce1182 TaxID=3133334 RepID=UPI003F642816
MTVLADRGPQLQIIEAVEGIENGPHSRELVVGPGDDALAVRAEGHAVGPGIESAKDQRLACPAPAESS